MADITESNRLRIRLIPSFNVTRDDQVVEFRSASAKLIAFLVLQRTAVERTIAASALWPDVSDSRAAANLRTLVWRIGTVDHELVSSPGSRLALEPTAQIDLLAHERLAHRVLHREPLERLATRLGRRADDRPEARTLEEIGTGVQRIIRCLTGDLLVHWFDDWLSHHQERWRQLRLHALDSLSVQLTEAGHHAAAIDAATATVAAEPLRESGYRSLIMAHLAEGNVSEAVRTHERYRELLEEELGVSPSLKMYELLSRATGTASPSGQGRSGNEDPGRAIPYPVKPVESGVGPPGTGR